MDPISFGKTIKEQRKFLGVNKNRAASFIDRFFTGYEKTLELVHRSFLSDEAKERFLVLLDERLKAIES